MADRMSDKSGPAHAAATGKFQSHLTARDGRNEIATGRMEA